MPPRGIRGGAGTRRHLRLAGSAAMAARAARGGRCPAGAAAARLPGARARRPPARQWARPPPPRVKVERSGAAARRHLKPLGPLSPPGAPGPAGLWLKGADRPSGRWVCAAASEGGGGGGE